MTVGLISGATFDVNNILLAVDFSDLSFLALELAAKNTDFVILADWDRADLLYFLIKQRVR